MSRKNLLAETIEALQQDGKTPADVLWVGGGKYAVTWDEFAAIADFEYSSGYGGQEIAKDLVVVGDGFWLERGEYDGAEWWEFKTAPTKPESPLPITALHTDGSWRDLADMNTADTPADAVRHKRQSTPMCCIYIPTCDIIRLGYFYSGVTWPLST